MLMNMNVFKYPKGAVSPTALFQLTAFLPCRLCSSTTSQIHQIFKFSLLLALAKNLFRGRKFRNEQLCRGESARSVLIRVSNCQAESGLAEMI